MLETDTRPMRDHRIETPIDPGATAAATDQATDELATDVEDAEAKELLAKAKLDHVPTIDEAKELLTARRAEIRHAVMLQADKRDWCEDGTRKVCANLRLERPGSRTNRQVEIEMTLKFTVTATSYTEEGALLKLKNGGVLSQKWIQGHLYVQNAEIDPTAVTIDGKVMDASMLIEKKPEVTA